MAGEETGNERVSKACVAGTERDRKGIMDLSGKYGALTIYMYTNHPFGIEMQILNNYSACHINGRRITYQM